MLSVLHSEWEHCKALVWRGSSCQMYNTYMRAGLSPSIFSCNLNILQTNSPKVWNPNFFQHTELQVFSLKKRTRVISCLRLLFSSCIKREPGMEMNQRDTSHLCYGCRCNWRWNYAGRKLCSSYSLYKKMGCKIRITTFRNSPCECSSTQLMFKREKFFLQKLSNGKDLRLQNNPKEIAAVYCRTPLPLITAWSVCLLLAVAWDWKSRQFSDRYSPTYRERNVPIAAPFVWSGGKRVLTALTLISLALWLALPVIVIINIFSTSKIVPE